MQHVGQGNYNCLKLSHIASVNKIIVQRIHPDILAEIMRNPWKLGRHHQLHMQLTLA